jgi:hypothetical protein
MMGWLKSTAWLSPEPSIGSSPHPPPMPAQRLPEQDNHAGDARCGLEGKCRDARTYAAAGSGWSLPTGIRVGAGRARGGGQRRRWPCAIWILAPGNFFSRKAEKKGEVVGDWPHTETRSVKSLRSRRLQQLYMLYLTSTNTRALPRVLKFYFAMHV